MSIWQNIKEADYSFEKLLLKGIAIGIAGIVFFFLIDKVFDANPGLKELLQNYSDIFYYYLIAFALTALITILIYQRSLGLYDCETANSKRALLINAVIWTIFWICWSIFCARMIEAYRATQHSINIILLIILMLPGFIAFLFSWSIRRDAIKENEENKEEYGDKYNPSDAYILFLDRKYFSGYYGLICLPVYLLYLFAVHLF